MSGSESFPSADRGRRKLPSRKAKQLGKKFDAGEDIMAYLDLVKARRPGHELKRVNVDFPLWMIQSLDREAERLGSR